MWSWRLGPFQLFHTNMTNIFLFYFYQSISYWEYCSTYVTYLTLLNKTSYKKNSTLQLEDVIWNKPKFTKLTQPNTTLTHTMWETTHNTTLAHHNIKQPQQQRHKAVTQPNLWNQRHGTRKTPTRCVGAQNNHHPIILRANPNSSVLWTV